MLFEALAVVVGYTAVAAFATWPLARDPLGGFYGFGNDNWGGTWIYGWIHDGYLGPGDPWFSPELQAPFGYPLPQQAIQPIERLVALAVGGFDQGLATYNLQIFASFVLSGCTMYVLARYLTGVPLAAFVGGFIYTFSPFHLAQAMQYAALASIQWLPVFVLALLLLLRDGKMRNALFAGLAFALVAATSYYQAWFLIWFALLVGASCVVGLAWRRGRERALDARKVGRFARRLASSAAVLIAVPVLVTGPFLVASLRGAAAAKETVLHPITEAVRYSGRPWMLFVPPHDNPIFGPHTRDWILTHLYDSPVYEQAIYLGYAALVLAALAVVRRARRKGLNPRESFAVAPLVGGMAAGLLIVMGPYVPLDPGYWRLWAAPDETAHLPSLGLAMYEIGPVFRFFSRAYMLVSVCLAALAAIGFAAVLRGRASPVARVGLTALVVSLVAVEYTNAPPHVWFADDRPAWVAAVRTLPAGSVVADYPLSPPNSPRSLYYMFWQREHRRATLNPHDSPEAQALAARVADVDAPAAGKALRDAGVDYAVVHTRLPPQTTPPYQPQLPDDSLPATTGALNPWLSVARRTSDAVIYRVLESPRRVRGAIIRARTGFGAAERERGFTARWLEAPVGELELVVGQRRRALRIGLTLASFAQSRRVVVAVDGRRIGVVTAPAGSYATFALSVPGPVPAGRHVITLTPSPGPQSIGQTLRTDDPRSVSIRLLAARVVS